MKRRVYLDYGASTPVSVEVLNEMSRVSSFGWANPSALYEEARLSQELIKEARKRLAMTLQVKPAHIFFTSGSTESNNLVIQGIAKRREKGEIVSTKIEHSSISSPLRELQKWGWKITHVPVDGDGVIEEDKLKNIVTKNTALVTYAWANTDIGTLQPIDTIYRIVKEKNSKTQIHIDASQAGTTLFLAHACKFADFVTISPSKTYGPKGIGILVSKSSRELAPLILGGDQEQSLRAGTENVVSVCGAALALEKAQKDYKKEAERLQKLINYLIAELEKIPGVLITGSKTKRLSNHVSCAVENADGEEISVRLDALGFAVGTGSACTTKGGDVSEAVKAIGVSKKYQRGTIRVTLGKDSVSSNLEEFVKAFKEVVTFIHESI